MEQLILIGLTRKQVEETLACLGVARSLAAVHGATPPETNKISALIQHFSHALKTNTDPKC